MKTNYNSVQIIASVIGSRSRKAMYLVQPESIDGNKIYKNTWIPVQWKSNNEDQRIEWDHHSQSYIELPMEQVTPSMLVDLHDKRNVSNVSHRIINGKNKAFLKLEQRILIYVPTWMMQNFKLKYNKITEENEELFSNEETYYGIAESQSAHLNNGLMEYAQDRASSTFNLQFAEDTIDSLRQWELDNPEYMQYE